MTSQSLAALRVERQAVLDFCTDLTAAEWAAPSRAESWDVKDVVAHLAAGMRALITPAAIGAMTTNRIERLNDRTVDRSRSKSAQQVLADFAAWSGRGVTALGLLTAPVVGRVALPVGELGVYPLAVFPAMYLFDWHTHLRHDIAPAIDKPVPPTDDERMTSVLGWLTTLLEQSHSRKLAWLDTAVALTLDGPGEGTWRIEHAANSTLKVQRGNDSGTTTQISGHTTEFPSWSTTRTSWRDCELAINGDTELGERFLDVLDLV